VTICVNIRVAEGLVLAADSATILRGDIQTPQGVQKNQLLQTFDFATKVAQVGDLPMGVMTWGLGSLDSRSIQSLVQEFEFDYEPAGRFRVEDVANDLLAFIMARYDAAFPAPSPANGLGLFVGGFSDGEFFSTQYAIELPGQRTWRAVRPDAPPRRDFGANWFGAADALERLILGYDRGALQQLVARGADATIVQKWVSDNVSSLPLIFDGMPLQDAIDFAEWATTVVIGRWRFGIGAQLVGGDVDIAVIRPRSFQWAQRKRWSLRGEGNDDRAAITRMGIERDTERRGPGDGDSPVQPLVEPVAPPATGPKRPVRAASSRGRRGGRSRH
jgi:hypothetical protein